MIGADRLDDAERLLPRRASSVSSQQPPEVAENFGEQGKRAWFWEGNKWNVGRAWAINANRTISGMCRDYGEWGIPYPGSDPMQTHCAAWQPAEVSWKRPPCQFCGPTMTCREHASAAGPAQGQLL